MLDVREEDLLGKATRGIVALHLVGMHANSPPESVLALGLAG